MPRIGPGSKHAEDTTPLGGPNTELRDAHHGVAPQQAVQTNLEVFTKEHQELVIMLPGHILFVQNQPELSSRGRARLDDLVMVLLAMRERLINIDGRPDAQSTASHNFDLLNRRAHVVLDYINERNYQPNLLQARGTIDNRPISGIENEDRRADEHRIEIVISADDRLLTP